MDQHYDDIPHGTLTAYTNYKCRCEKCTKVKRDYLREHRARNPEKYREYQRRYDARRKALRETRKQGPFAKKLRAIKEERGYTQDDIARLCKCSRTTVVSWLSGHAQPHRVGVESVWKALEKDAK